MKIRRPAENHSKATPQWRARLNPYVGRANMHLSSTPSNLALMAELLRQRGKNASMSSPNWRTVDCFAGRAKVHQQRQRAAFPPFRNPLALPALAGSQKQIPNRGDRQLAVVIESVW